jgi:putative peptide zinc metalloprotease protein
MDELTPTDLALPALREDLQLHRGVANRDGQATWTIQDPIAQRFYEVDDTLVKMLSLWHCGCVSGVDALLRAQGISPPDATQWTQMLGFLEQHGLLRPTPGKTFGRARAARPQLRWWQRLMHGYLFIKVPLAHPDAFLRRTLAGVQIFFTRTWLLACVLSGLLGLYLVSRQWEHFLATFADLKSPAGVALFGCSLAAVKAMHELGHGYTAVRHGVRVTSMGVALMVMVPVLYTDTTDAWRVASRRARLAIDLAGIAVELMLAVAATLAWVLLPDGLARYIAFALATSGWTMSLVVNLNPLMRFDGYYVFSDWLNLPNLQERSFAMGRWWLRRSLWGWLADAPEAISARRRGLLIGYAIAIWVYRLTLYLGIALLVYHFFFKALGIVMFGIEVMWFVALPIWRELRAWQQRRGQFSERARWTVGGLVALLLGLVVPWPGTLHVPAVVAAEDLVPAYAPRPAQVQTLAVRVGERVRAGQTLLVLDAPELASALTRAVERAAVLDERVARASADAQDRADALVLHRELLLERERIAGLTRDQARLTVRAPIDGQVVQLAQELHPGRWVDARMNLAWIAGPEKLSARGYIAADDALRLDPTKPGAFRDENLSGGELPVKVQRTASAATRAMDLWLLASSYGGPIATRESRDRPQAEQALVEIKAEVSATPSSWPLHEVRGELLLPAHPSSLAARAWRRVVQVWNRERAA